MASCKQLKRAKRDEEQAIKFYGGLIKKTPDRKVKRVIREIRNDERDHRKQFVKLIRKQCGRVK